MMVFNNTDEILRSTFITQNIKGEYILNPVVERNVFLADFIEITCSYTGNTYRFLTDQELFDIYQERLPDATDGKFVVFYSTIEAYKNLTEQLIELNEGK